VVKLIVGTSKNSIFSYHNPLGPPFLRGNKRMDVSLGCPEKLLDKENALMGLNQPDQGISKLLVN
jgi:hypothetical protein|tara:strand:- start:223 stop:417 length:195 start_codon:yes stop_codon:yes gene_type:complete